MARLSGADLAAVGFAVVLSALLLSGPPGRVMDWLAMPAAAALVVAWIAASDVVSLTIPDGASIALAVLGLADRLALAAGLPGEPWTSLALAALDAALCGGALLLLREAFFRRRGFDGLGLGDVKLAAAGGILCGTAPFFWALFAASLAGLSILLATGQHRDRLAKTPFGALLAPACWLVWVLGR